MPVGSGDLLGVSILKAEYQRDKNGNLCGKRLTLSNGRITRIGEWAD